MLWFTAVRISIFSAAYRNRMICRNGSDRCSWISFRTLFKTQILKKKSTNSSLQITSLYWLLEIDWMRAWVTGGWLNEGLSHRRLIEWSVSHRRLIEWGSESQEVDWMRMWVTGGWLNEGVNHIRFWKQSVLIINDNQR